jgi:hypothetical protein
MKAQRTNSEPTSCDMARAHPNDRTKRKPATLRGSRASKKKMPADSLPITGLRAVPRNGAAEKISAILGSEHIVLLGRWMASGWSVRVYSG